MGNVGDAALVLTICALLRNYDISYDCPSVREAEALTDIHSYDSLLYFGNDTLAYYGISKDLIQAFIFENKPIYLINLSYGEKTKNNYLDKIASYDHLHIYARDKYSQHIIQSKVKPKNDVCLCADLAHLLPDSFDSSRPLSIENQRVLSWLHSSPKPVLVINLHSDFGEYTQEIHSQFDTFLQIHSETFRFIFLPHDSRVKRGELSINQEHFEKNQENSFLSHVLDPEFEIFVLRQCFAVVTCRMHLGILALRAGIPPFIVGYNGVKAKGLLDHWDLEGELYVDPSSPKDLTSKFNHLVSNYGMVRTHISLKYPSVSQLALKPILDILNQKKNLVSPLQTTNQALSQGICSGCGACHVNSDMPHSENIYGEILPPSNEISAQSHMSDVCPFVDETASEYDINGSLYSSLPHHHPDVGFYSQICAGHVQAGSYRSQGASGGLVKWFLVQAMKKGIVDSVIQVKQTSNPVSLFEYYIAENADEVRAGAKSAYYPTNYASVIREILNDTSPNSYAFVGLPCFCHSLRLLQQKFPILKQKIPMVVAIFCGHLKSKNYLDLMSLQAGRTSLDGEIVSADFRYKLASDINASRYNFVARLSDGAIYSRQRTSIPAGDWKVPHLKLKACDFCEDVFGLAADVVFGDAWISPYFQDPKGSNIVIVRSPAAHSIINTMDNDLMINDVSVRDLIKSQGGSYKHRIKDIGFRLQAEVDKFGWAPIKRSKPIRADSSHSSSVRRQRIQQLRVQIREVTRTQMALLKAGKITLNDYNARLKSISTELNQLY